jgi:hypothetical protein
MERRIYELTQRDWKNAEKKAAMREKALADIESHKDDRTYWKRRQTTFGLAKREAAALALQGDIEWHKGRGQGILDQLQGLSYTVERRSPAYNAGYHAGYLGSKNEMREYIAANPNFQNLEAS